MRLTQCFQAPKSAALHLQSHASHPNPHPLPRLFDLDSLEQMAFFHQHFSKKKSSSARCTHIAANNAAASIIQGESTNLIFHVIAI
jgi:hypothetical protein